MSERSHFGYMDPKWSLRGLYRELQDLGKIGAVAGMALVAGCGVQRGISVRTDPPSPVRVEMEGQVFEGNGNGTEITWELEWDKRTGKPWTVWGAGVGALAGAFLVDRKEQPYLAGGLLGAGLILTPAGISMARGGREVEGSVRVERDGYYPAEVFFISNGRDRPRFEVELTPVREYPIEINSVPEGAGLGIVRRRGGGYGMVEEGQTPYRGRFEDTAGSGIGTARITKAGYREWVGNIDLERMPALVGLQRER